MDDSEGPSSCKRCKTPVGSADYTVNCESCAGVFHYGCGGYNDSTYSAFKKLHGVGLASFLCPSCKVEVPLLFRKVTSLESQAAQSTFQAEVRLSNLETKLDTISESLAAMVTPEPPCGPTGEPTGTQRKSYSAVASTGIHTQAKVVVADLQRAKEEESHRRSIVVAGLPERGHDNEDVTKLVTFLDPSAVLCETYRMGRVSKPGDGPTRPRLLKVHLPSSSVVKSVLGEARKLKESPDFNGVFIRRSMTLEERKNLGKMRSKCRELNEKEDAEGVKYAVVNEQLVKFTGCHLDGEGRLWGGTRDRTWHSVDSDSDNLN